MTRKEVTQLSFNITGCAIKVHRELGPGLLENVYEECLKYQLEKEGYAVKQQLSVKINYDGLELESNLKVDLLVNDCVVVELKSVAIISAIHEAQILTYMKLLQKPQGLLINFNVINITKSIKPFINEYFFKLKE